MTQDNFPIINPKLDLVIERVVDVPREKVWEAWTHRDLLMQWFCPLPWKVIECEVDLRPGGVFRTEMRGPEGESSSTIGTYLEIVPNERLVWTIGLLPGYRPAPGSGGVPHFTAFILLDEHERGTKYRAIACHADEAGARQHEEMGFHEGWGIVLEQMVALIKHGRVAPSTRND